MFDESDSESSIGVAVALAIAIFAALFAIGMAAGTSLGIFGGTKAAAEPGTAASLATPVGTPMGAASATAAASASAPTAATAATTARLYFDLGKHDLPADALTKLEPLVTALRSDDKARVIISGFHDASGNAAANAELAKQRAFAVRELLMTAGVSAERIDMLKPLLTTGGADPQEARRVDVTLR